MYRLRRLAVVVVMTMLAVAAGGAAASAAPAPGLCVMNTGRGVVPAKFAMDACVDAKSIWLRNTLKVPVTMGVAGDTGTPVRVQTDVGLAAQLTRLRYPNPLLLLPGDIMRIPVGSGAASVTIANTDAGGFYALAWTAANFLPGKPIQVSQAFTDLLAELNNAMGVYNNCIAKAATAGGSKGAAKRVLCQAALAKTVTLAVAKSVVTGAAKGIAAPILSGRAFISWAGAQPGQIATILGSTRTISLAAVVRHAGRCRHAGAHLRRGVPHVRGDHRWRRQVLGEQL
jgi:hypothetical protein